jgi:preprotein translocase subunit SecB
MLSPLQLRQHSLLEVSLKEREACKLDGSQIWIPGEPEVKVDIATSQQDLYQTRIFLQLTSQKVLEDDDQSAWDFHLRLVGYFIFADQKTPKEKAQSLSLVNGASMLFGVARDILYGLSLRGQKPSILLPSMNFQEWAGKPLVWSTAEPVPLQPASATKPAGKRAKKSTKAKA